MIAFAVAMAWMEAATVYYIRELVDRIEPYQAQPLPMHGALGNVELAREASTLVLFAVVGWLAGRTWREHAGYAAVAFGIWDILYYVFLRPMTGWPRTLLDWDILFLNPVAVVGARARAREHRGLADPVGRAGDAGERPQRRGSARAGRGSQAASASSSRWASS